MAKLFFLCCFFLLFILRSESSFAQENHKHNYWLSVGLGKTQFPSAMIAFGYESRNKPILITARHTFNGEILSDNLPGIKVSDFGLLYGIRTGKFSFSTGLSGVWGTDRGKFIKSDPDPLINGSNIYEPVKYATVGLPGEIRFITSKNGVGVGITAFGNLNSKRSFAGINLSLYVGQMKR